VLQKRLAAAAYQSLISQETVEARRLLRQIPITSLPKGRWISYWLCSLLPSSLLRAIVDRRVPTVSHGATNLPVPAESP
jgi:hypothetical protein